MQIKFQNSAPKECSEGLLRRSDGKKDYPQDFYTYALEAIRKKKIKDSFILLKTNVNWKNY